MDVLMSPNVTITSKYEVVVETHVTITRTYAVIMAPLFVTSVLGVLDEDCLERERRFYGAPAR